jgi:hypothetical protein
MKNLDVQFLANVSNEECKKRLCSGLAAIGPGEDSLESFR